MNLVILRITLLLVALHSANCSPCNARSFGEDSVVCVCNATYCDSFQPLEPSTPDKVQVLISSRDGLRHESNVVQVTKGDTRDKADVDITIDSSKTFQSIIGFGAAFTDAAGISASLIGDKMAQQIIDQCYSPHGLKYNLGRVVIGGSDFSDHSYSYDDTDGFQDFTLDRFNLTREDFSYKIPFVKRAKSVAQDEVLLYATAWSAPAWMKTNNALNGRGSLKGEPSGSYYKAWANYYVKFLNAYKKENIEFWGLTSGNEPINGLIPRFPFNCLGFTPSKQRDFIKYHLGPVLNSSNYGHLKLMILDDQRYLLPIWADKVLKDAEASKYISGIGVHWYGDKLSPASILSMTHNRHPEKFILGTEATHVGKPLLGNWKRAEMYLSSIITDTNNFMSGWVEWNFALNLTGGPNWVNNFCDSPIIVNGSSGEFYKQPMFYALAHVTRFVPRNSTKIDIKVKDHSWKLPLVTYVQANSFVTPSGQKVIVVLNKHSKSRTFKIYEVVDKLTYRVTLPAKSFATFIRS